ncbi:MAG: molybdopterin molybdotransferase [Chloroflexi bacterium]|nr:MAG: molybdopterin molybdotransferase [Chloroflexota bacterium]MBA4376692.1 molybdopterin molybdenumtransferase MoeA [Anaerolinea sp.]
MPEFLKLQSVEEAKSIFWQKLPKPSLGSELVETGQALGRVLNVQIVAEEYLPAFTRSTVDGFAVSAEDTYGAADSLPAYLKFIGEVSMGSEPDFVIRKGETALIHTGGMLPEGADAVVMLETTQRLENGVVEIYKPVSPEENILVKGEDVKPGDILIEHGSLVRPEEIGGLLALGKTKVEVTKRPKVGILSSGDEIIPPDFKPEAGQVRDINTGALAALITACGGISISYPIVPDDPELLEQAVRKAYEEADLVVITAGSSASARDMTAEVIQRIGEPGVLVHGINIRPGKPTILAVCNGKPLIGLPGNPISALVIARLFVKPLIERLSGLTSQRLELTITAHLNNSLPSQAGRDEYFPVKIIRKGSQWYAEPIFFKSNLIFNLVNTDGLLHIPADVTGYSAGDLVDVVLI